MIMGEICTRGCAFCNVATGKPDVLDVFEPARIADTVKKMYLKHVRLKKAALGKSFLWYRQARLRVQVTML